MLVGAQFVLLLLMFAGSAGSQPLADQAGAVEPIRYTLRFPDPASHHLDVEAVFPTGGAPDITLKMAVWTPYVIREYAQNIETLTTPLGAEKVRKNRWRVRTGGQPTVTVRYRLFAHSMNVQDAFVDNEFAILNGQPVYLTLAAGPERPHEVRLEVPPSWKDVVTVLPEVGPRHYRAASYEDLMDAPIVAGNAKMYSFDVDGIQHALVNIGGDRTQWDGPQSTADLARIVRAQRDVSGFFPYKRYLFLNVLSGKGGGMEHQECTMMMASPDATRRRETYVRWLSLASHELFHAWNVKRLRPREITPGEYEEEQYTRSLGIAEGFTSYYGSLSLRRAGVISEAEYFNELSRLVEGLQRSEGRRVQSLADSSFDTWIKFYKPNENSPNTTVSYYTKGAVVAFVLDARIQAASGGARTLDLVMREMLRRYPRERGYTLDDFAEVAGVDIKPYFFSTDELDYKEAAAWFGLKISPSGKVEPQGRNSHRDEWLAGKRQ